MPPFNEYKRPEWESTFPRIFGNCLLGLKGNNPKWTVAEIKITNPTKYYFPEICLEVFFLETFLSFPISHEFHYSVSIQSPFSWVWRDKGHCRVKVIRSLQGDRTTSFWGQGRLHFGPVQETDVLPLHQESSFLSVGQDGTSGGGSKVGRWPWQRSRGHGRGGGLLCCPYMYYFYAIYCYYFWALLYTLSKHWDYETQ